MFKKISKILLIISMGVFLAIGCGKDDSDSPSSSVPEHEVGYDGDPSSCWGHLNHTNEYLVYLDNAKLLPYIGGRATKVKINYFNSGDNPATHDFTVRIYGKGTATSPGIKLFEQTYTFNKGWNTITLSNPFVIDSVSEIWAGYLTSINEVYASSVDAGPLVDNINWIKIDNGTYAEYTQGNLNIRLIVEK